ncbi:tripartite tricarboxylate transporter TctB family protein [Frigidibacter sp. ROC022]|uniref:tripartite tricarboxylate transporter TctB family protein n=1 Tax=Frigidibacter sp. ROC022 TaxID=2971796 RepID=UPI00215AD307|nr:tripartite tricarboxylate transporter TctB family protein [Frigidibacter sp. ROC022]MCR8725203.1 tripartite tricarboxylate transporter TctB family protein [Frigidibacter sp. ROC022]
MKARPNSDLLIGLAFTAGGLGICYQAAGLRPMPGMVVGSGLFPTITGAAMCLFGLVLAVESLLRPSEGGDAAPGAGPDRRRGALPLYSVLVLVGLALLGALLPSVGFILCGVVFTALVTRLGGAGWTGSLVFALIATFGLYYVFVYGLRVPLPHGLWGF